MFRVRNHKCAYVSINYSKQIINFNNNFSKRVSFIDKNKNYQNQFLQLVK